MMTAATKVPIWMEALNAIPCQVSTNGSERDVRWDYVCGRAMYTNVSEDVEIVEPLGVCLKSGETLAVCWVAGETAYSLEVYKVDRHYIA